MALVSLATLADGCNKQEAMTAAVSAETSRAPNQTAVALNPPNVPNAAVSQKAAEDLKAVDAQKLPEATAQKQVESDRADQALNQEAVDQPAVEPASVDKHSLLATGGNKLQALIDSAKALSGENKWAVVLQILARLAGENLSPVRWTAVDSLRSEAQKHTQAAVAKTAASNAQSGLGSLLDPKK